MQVTKYFFNLITLLLLTCNYALAHPHAYVDMNAKIIVEQDKLIGIKKQWIFDSMSSAPLLYELKIAKENGKSKLLNKLIDNIIKENYFTKFYGGNKIEFKFNNQPTDYDINVIGGKLILSFTAWLQQPQPIKNNHFTLLTYDPTYFINMRYENMTQIAAIGSKQCKLSLVEPKVNHNLFSYALGLDRFNKVDRTLGVHFSQKLEIQC